MTGESWWSRLLSGKSQHNSLEAGRLPTQSGALIDLRQVVKAYDTPAGPLEVLKHINLQVSAGEFVAIIGRSGSGKSTLINMITGVDRPTSGVVIVGGVVLNSLDEDQIARWRGMSLGVIFQFFQLLPTLTLLENVMLPMELCNTYPLSERVQRGMQLLKAVGMTDQAHKFPAAVSGGQQQRTAIARALANEPQVLVADEPTGSLDTETAVSIVHLFQTFVHQGGTILMVTHDRDLAQQASRVVMLAQGEVVERLSG